MTSVNPLFFASIAALQRWKSDVVQSESGCESMREELKGGQRWHVETTGETWENAARQSCFVGQNSHSLTLASIMIFTPDFPKFHI